MKKKNLKNLLLNKTVVSNLVKGGDGRDITRQSPCAVKSDGGACDSLDCGPVGDVTVIATCAAGCTSPTDQLSYCAGGGVPHNCLSIQACA
ncbi:hypothetical protein [uncultured Kordia sp.]|uniref:hypothetical protein n=1 Tax=uncultured Kordia sp. TaxID=507699 RepID=UPI002620FC34|nr:hypothetical protein [uncultured Kordia sp.]